LPTADVATAQINGTELFYLVEGSGPPLIVLHGGLGFDHTYMRASLEPLEDVRTMIYVDQRGNGRSERPPLETITIPQLAADVDALRDHLGHERVGVLGHSYGGFVALEYATTYPDRVSHLVCEDTSPGVFEPTEAELAERPDPSWITPEIQAGFEYFGSLMASGETPTDEGFRENLPTVAPVYLYRSDPSVLAGNLGDMIVNAEVAMHSMRVALPGWSVADKLDRVTAPTIVLCGRYDLMTTPECSKRLSTGIAGAELVWFENSGHFPSIEETDAFVSALRAFFARTP
jgi:proline iminopeptidase